MTLTRLRTEWIAVLALVAGGVAAQTEVAADASRVFAWRPPVELGLPMPSSLAAGLLAHSSRFDAGREDFAPLPTVEPYPITRETLDGEGETLHRFEGIPGGIVLGLRAATPAELRGARLERDGSGALGLRLDAGSGGGFVRAPSFSPERLRLCARFVRGHLDGLVDLGSGPPRIAPAFAGTELAELLVRMDQLPHRLAPETREWKTLIVDRSTGVELRGDELVFPADLEVRCYGDGDGTGWARRALRIEASGAEFVGPRLAHDLGRELSPLAELAGWLGFLRWVESADPAGFVILCE